ncbi:hypothetical protein Agub_g1482, partial [Astrephomene gubernaculifera]
VPRQEEALARVLGACILVVGICSFTVVILLIQQFQRANAIRDTPGVVAVSSCQACTPTESIAQCQLSKGGSLRQRPERDHAHRAAHGSMPNRQSFQADHVSPLQPIPSIDNGCTVSAPKQRVSAVNSAKSSIPPEVLLATGPSPAAMDRTFSSCRQSISSTASDRALATGSREVDLSLLSRIDQALSSGVMRPDQASQLLKSFGCDLEELLKEELEGKASSRSSSSIPFPGASRLHSGPASGHLDSPDLGNRGCEGSGSRGGSMANSRGIVGSLSPSSNSDNIARRRDLRYFSYNGKDPQEARDLRFYNRYDTDLMLTSSPRSAYASASQSAAVGGGGNTSNTTTSRPPSTGQLALDDALLLKIDQALTSGVMRPDQATQLLKSYGCDLEDLLEEDFGEAGLRRSDNGAVEP